MGENMPNIHLTPVEVDGHNQPVLVSAYVEHKPAIDLINRWKGGTQLREASKLGLSDDFVPADKCGPAVGVLFPEQAERLARDDVHFVSLSQNEMKRNGSNKVFRFHRASLRCI
jgi:hypothetical protein